MYICIYVYMYICIYVYMYICIYVYMYICIYVCVYICMCVYLYIYIHMVTPPPPKIYTCRLHTISCFFAHMCTLVISTETTVNIGVFRCCPRMQTTLLLRILFRYIDKSAAEFRSTNISLYVFGKLKLSEGSRVICCVTQEPRVLLHFSVVKEL